MAVALVDRKIQGAMLKQMRDVRGFDQIDIACVLGCSDGKVSQVERGISEYSTRELVHFARLIDAPFVALVDWLTFDVDMQTLSFRDWYATALAAGPKQDIDTRQAHKKVHRSHKNGSPDANGITPLCPCHNSEPDWPIVTPQRENSHSVQLATAFR